MNVNWALVTLAGYALILILIGVVTARKATSSEAFLLADRNLGPWVAGLSYAASSSSAWVLLGFSGFVFVAGPSALWMVPGIIAGYLAIWLWAGPVLQRASREKNHLTLTDFLAEDASPVAAIAIRWLASLMIAFCFSYYVAAQFQGAVVAFTGLFDLTLAQAVCIGAAIILAYTLFGGFLAVSVVDTVQGALMALVAIVLPVVALQAAGGWSGIGDAIATQSDSFVDPFGGRAGLVALGFVVGLFATGFGALGQPHLAAWIMAARDPMARSRGALIAALWALIVYAGMAVLGLSAKVLFTEVDLAEGVFFTAAGELLPPALAGVIVAATLSAIMSTVDSQLLVVGGAVSHDLGLAKRLRLNEVWISRIAIIAVCGAALALTLFLPSSIFDRTLFAWTALGASIGPTVVARVTGRRPTGWSVALSLAVGFAASLAYEFAVPSGPGAVYARTVPWLLAFVPLWIGMRHSPKRAWRDAETVRR